MARSKLYRAALITAAGAVAALSTVFATPTATSAAPVSNASTSCQPAYTMTGAERAKLPTLRMCNRGTGPAVGAQTPKLVQPDLGSLSGNINKTTDVASLNTDYYFDSKYEVSLTGTALRDINCDGRSVYADLYDGEGFLAEFKNGLGCNQTATWAVEHVYDNGGVEWIYFTLYACNSTSCSTPHSTANYYSSRW